jgi:hypothetical protein
VVCVTTLPIAIGFLTRTRSALETDGSAWPSIQTQLLNYSTLAQSNVMALLRQRASTVQLTVQHASVAAATLGDS